MDIAGLLWRRVAVPGLAMFAISGFWGCDEGGPAEPSTQTSAAVAPTLSPEVQEKLTPPPAEPTPPERWAVPPPGPCPVEDERVCTVAIEVETAFRAGDIDGVMAFGEPFPLTCPATEDLLSSSVCKGTPGATVEAYAGAKFGGSAGLMSPENMRELLLVWTPNAETSAAEARTFEIAAVGCADSEAAAAECEQFVVALRFMQTGSEGILRLVFRRGASGEPRFFATMNDVPWNEDLRGAEDVLLGYGTGAYFPMARGRFYPWNPERSAVP